MRRAGAFVTRVDLPRKSARSDSVPERSGASKLVQVPPQDDPLTVAGTLGRPMAILRIGGRTGGSYRPMPNSCTTLALLMLAAGPHEPAAPAANLHAEPIPSPQTQIRHRSRGRRRFRPKNLRPPPAPPSGSSFNDLRHDTGGVTQASAIREILRTLCEPSREPTHPKPWNRRKTSPSSAPATDAIVPHNAEPAARSLSGLAGRWLHRVGLRAAIHAARGNGRRARRTAEFDFRSLETVGNYLPLAKGRIWDLRRRRARGFDPSPIRLAYRRDAAGRHAGALRHDRRPHAVSNEQSRLHLRPEGCSGLRKVDVAHSDNEFRRSEQAESTDAGRRGGRIAELASTSARSPWGPIGAPVGTRSRSSSWSKSKPASTCTTSNRSPRFTTSSSRTRIFRTSAPGSSPPKTSLILAQPSAAPGHLLGPAIRRSKSRWKAR